MKTFLGNGIGVGVQLGTNLNYKTITPPDIAGGVLWFTSEDVVSVDGKVSQLTEKFSGINHAVQITADKQPSIVANALNGKPKIVFNGLKNRLFTPVVNISQPYTVFIVYKLLATATDKALMGSKSAPLSAIGWYFNANKTSVFSGSERVVEASQNTELSAMAIKIGNPVEYYRNGFQETVSQAGTNNISTAFNIGGYDDADTANANYEFYETIVYNGDIGIANRLKIIDYLQEKYNSSFGLQRKILNYQTEKFNNTLFDNSVDNSVQSGYVSRSAFSEYSFYTTDEFIQLSAISTIYSYYPSQSLIAVYEDDVFKTTVSFIASNGTKTVALKSGNKKITLVESQQTLASNPFTNPLGTYITGIKAKSYNHSTEGIVNVKLVFIGDSITGGGDYATNAAQQGVARLFKVENGISSACLGTGSARLYHFANNADAISSTVNRILALFENCNGRKILPILIGTNDFGVSSTASATFKSWYEALLDAIHLADPLIEVYCVSPLIRGNDAQLLDDYRAAINTICLARSTYCTHIAGKTILSLTTDFGKDQLHPTIAGSKKYKDALYSVIFPT